MTTKDKSDEMQKINTKGFSLELLVGIFMLLGVAAIGYLSVGLAGVEMGTGSKYSVVAEFDNVSGLKYGASVEIGGVPIGEVTNIELKGSNALVSMRIVNEVSLFDEDIASIRTKGIIGDRYVKISRGASQVKLAPGARLTETESVVDLEDVIGKIIHSLGSGDKKEDK